MSKNNHNIFNNFTHHAAAQITKLNDETKENVARINDVLQTTTPRDIEYATHEALKYFIKTWKISYYKNAPLATDQ